jgi:DNA-binding transcriptional regulator of glucitol operon
VRRFFTPAWLGLHVLAVTLSGAFLGFGWWQLQRAQEGNGRSWGYVFEWPVFSVFVFVMWIKMIRDELSDDGKPAEEDPVEPGRPVSEAELIKQHEAQDENLAAYNRYLARLNAQTPGAGGAGGSSA